jgi:predicted dienelactone hydrolase
MPFPPVPLKLLLISTVVGAVAAASDVASAQDVGVRGASVPVPARKAAIDLDLWYPAKSDGVLESFGESKIFQGVPARRGASPADGMFPVVLLAHGGMRANPTAAGWIAADLAAQGYIVVVPRPPELGPKDAARAVSEVWLRPADLSAALTNIENDPSLAPHIAPNKVAAVGFFLGGTSALAVIGARLDAKSYKGSCDDPTNGPDCRWFAESGIDLHGLDDKAIAQSHLDGRIGMAIAVNPELLGNFSADSMAQLSALPHFVALGDVQVAAPENCDALSCYAAISDATPFSAFAECKAEAAALLAEEGEDDSICRDGGGRSRAEIHAEIASLIASALARHLP